MTVHVPRLPFSLDPLIAEAKRRMRRRRLLIAAAIVAVAAGSVFAIRAPGGPGSTGGSGALSGSGRVGSVRIDSGGRVGPLRMNRSTSAQVIAFAGRPDLDQSYLDRYQVLGYGCAAGAGTVTNWYVDPVACRTSFYLVGGRLSLFITQDRRFEAAGVLIGTATGRAERLLHRKAVAGCNEVIGVQGKQTRLALPLTGGKLHAVGRRLHVEGGRVDAFYLHGRRDPGVTDCD
ncbi:MAG TPA: hypothetical protein VJ716_05190 [Gaiellaceae bacterium]|nr:hypothetical protein [Gaiellaceae bacterium]